MSRPLFQEFSDVRTAISSAGTGTAIARPAAHGGAQPLRRPEPGERYAQWAQRFILFHQKRHPRELKAAEVVRFLEHVARTEKNAVDALKEAHEALSFLYREVLGLDLGPIALPQPPRLLDRLRMTLRVRHYSPRTETCYLDWTERFIRFHGLRHPKDMGAAEVSPFLTDLAVNGHVAASTQNQALNALVFLYTQVLELDLGRLDAVRARRPKYLPTVLAPEEWRKFWQQWRAPAAPFSSWPNCCTAPACAVRNALNCASTISTCSAAKSSCGTAREPRIGLSCCRNPCVRT